MTPVRVTLFLILLLTGLLCALATPAESSSKTFEIVISKRAFSPEVTTLTVGIPVTLVLRNEDSELHAFVPLLLFQKVNVQVSGNGAPQFNEAGFARVLIPSHGRAELRFTPKNVGTFFYICDLPGHNMRGEIIVSDTTPP
jgi:plastocyanin